MSKTNVHITDTRRYKCKYCREKYIPNRRRVQKYCSASCRSKAYHLRTTKKIKDDISNKEKGLKAINPKEYNSKVKVEKMSVEGIGNAAAGTLAINLITNALTPEEKKPATKGDLTRIEDRLKRYHRVMNYSSKLDGSIAYFDLETKKVIYSKNLFL